MQTRFANVLLSVILLLLVAIVFKPLLEPKAAAAAAPTQYKVAEIIPSGQPIDLKVAENRLNELSKDGWTLVECPVGFAGCVFKK